MYPQHAPSSQRRRKKCHTHGLRTVEVSRGRNGYGFTISGNCPCILSCIVSDSPADQAGLKTGDHLMGVNGLNISGAPHDEVVRMIGSSSGLLILQIAENCNSSDSSEDEFTTRPKTKYPNRKLRQVQKTADDQAIAYPRDRYRERATSHHNSGKTGHHGSGKPRAPSPGRELDEIMAYHERQMMHRYHHTHHRDVENINPFREAGAMHLHAHGKRNRVPNTGAADSHGPKHTIITREHRLGITKRQKSQETGEGRRYQPDGEAISNSDGRLTPKDLSNILRPSFHPRVEQRPDSRLGEKSANSSDSQDAGNLQAVVCYVGSLELPRDVRYHSSRLQSIRSAVQRLQLSSKRHKLVLMEVSLEGIRLIDKMGIQMAYHAAKKVVFSGHSEDIRFFGIVTQSDDLGSSCHIFMVDPKLCDHSVHVATARSFRIRCLPDPRTQECLQFPYNPYIILQHVSKLYEGRDDADRELPAVHAVHLPRVLQRDSNSSNGGDSGLDIGREDPISEAVCVVDMSNDSGQQAEASGCSSQLELENSESTNPSIFSQSQSLYGTDISLNSTDRYQLSGTSEFSNISSSDTTTDNSSQVIMHKPTTLERLNLRVMPDPKIAPNVHGRQGSGSHWNESRQSAINLRKHAHQGQKIAKVDLHVQHGNSATSSQSKNDQINFYPEEEHSRESLNTADFTNYENQRIDPNLIQQTISGTPSAFLVPAPFAGGRRQQRHAPIPASIPAVPKCKPPIPTHKPPIPDRHPLSARATPKTPIRPPSERPKSTPPIKMFESALKLTLEEQELAAYEKLCNNPGDTSLNSSKRSSKVDDDSKLLRANSFRQLKNTNRTILSGSHESLVVNNSSAERGQDDKLNGGSTSGLKGQYQDGTPIGRAASWAVGFNKLLADTSGVYVFSEFLKKEFSEENITFWKLCDEYKKITDEAERKDRATEMYERHIASGSLDPVNVDSQARQIVKQGLDQALPALFEEAQKQIFLLMKQDSYPRFLKSDLYKECVLSEMEGKPLPSAEEKTEKKVMKKIKSTSSTDNTTGEEKRRRSLLPWNRAKERGEKRLSKMATDPDLRAKAMASLTDLARSSDQQDGIISVKDTEANTITSNGTAKEGLSKLCRVILPNGSSTVISCVSGESVQEALAKLCYKRNLSLIHMEAVYSTSERPVDVQQDIQYLSGQEFSLVRRVVFRLDLQGRKSVVVRVNPNCSIREVLQLLLVRFNLKLDNMVVHTHGSGTSVDTESSVDTVEDQRLIVQTVEDFAGKKKKEWGKFSFHRNSAKVVQHKNPGRPETPRSAGGVSEDSSTINDLLRDLLNGQPHSSVVFDESGIWDPDKKDDKIKNEARGSGMFGFIRRNSIGEKEGNKLKNKSRVAGGSQKATAPAVPRSIPGKKPTGTDKEEERFLQLLNRAQSRQLDDQRGISTLNLEMPDFLKIPDNDNGTQPKLRRTELHNSDSSLYEKVIDSRRLSRSQEGLNVLSRTNSINVSERSHHSGGDSPHKISYMDQSFSKEGVVPSHLEAEEYFSQIEAFTDSPEFGNSSLRDIGIYNSQRSTNSFKMRVGDEVEVESLEPAWQHHESHAPLPEKGSQREVDTSRTTHYTRKPGRVHRRLPVPPQKVVTKQEIMDTDMANYTPPTPVGSVISKKLSHTTRTHLQFQSGLSLAADTESDLELDLRDNDEEPTVGGRSGSTPSPTTHDLVLESGPDSPEQTPCPPPRRRTPSKSGIESADVQISMV